MTLMPLSVQIAADTERTTFAIHNFHPEVRPITSSVSGLYDFTVLSQGAYNAPVQVRVFMSRDEVIALYDKLTPIVAAYRQGEAVEYAAPATPQAVSGAPEVALL